MKESKFLKIKCPRCRETHTTFGNATTKLKCRLCNFLLIKPKGGKAKIRAEIKEVL